MATPRGLDRLVTFADAVVAIAITLLVLPLVDIPLSPHHDSPVGQLIRDHIGSFGTFLLSFVVIARLWMVHHQTFEHVRTYDPPLVRLTMAWLVTVVFLPFPTELLGSGSMRGASALYIGTLLASSLLLSITIAWVHAHPGLQVPVDELGPVRRPRWATPATLGIAFAIALVNDVAGLWALLLQLLVGPIESLVDRLRGEAMPPADVLGTPGRTDGPAPGPSA